MQFNFQYFQQQIISKVRKSMSEIEFFESIPELFWFIKEERRVLTLFSRLEAIEELNIFIKMCALQLQD